MTYGPATFVGKGSSLAPLRRGFFSPGPPSCLKVDNLYNLYMKVSATDARRLFARLLERVIAGEEVLVERHGRVIARLVPAGEAATGQAGIPAGVSPVRGLAPEAPLARILTERAAARYREARELAERALQRLANHGVRARLIGSLAKGTFRATSDIDILIEDAGGSSAQRIEEVAREAIGDFPFDIVFPDEIAPTLRKHFQ